MRQKDKHKGVFLCPLRHEKQLIKHMCVSLNMSNMAWDIMT